MKTITISKTKLARILMDNAEYVGSTEWDVYVCISDSSLDVRHNIEPADEWVEIYDFYYGYSREQLGMDDDNFSAEDLADWLKSDGVNLDQIETEINGYWDEPISLTWA